MNKLNSGQVDVIVDQLERWSVEFDVPIRLMISRLNYLYQQGAIDELSKVRKDEIKEEERLKRVVNDVLIDYTR